MNTLERIHQAATVEFLEKGFQAASLRKIVKAANVTTGAFYGYYKSKEKLFEALVGEPYRYLMGRFKQSQNAFASLPNREQIALLPEYSGTCMLDMLHYAYAHLDACKLLLCCAEGTPFAGMIDEMVQIEVDSTHVYQNVLRDLGKQSPQIDSRLEHILITGMFHTFFELVIHEMPLEEAETYLTEMRAFYTAGWMKIMGQ